MSDPLEELRVKPSMNGLIATTHGEPTSMRDIANGLVALGGLMTTALLTAAVYGTTQLGVPGDGMAVPLSMFLAFLLFVNAFTRRSLLRRLRDHLAERFLPTRQAVTVLELTPRRLLINRTSELPRTLNLTEIKTIRREGGLLLLEGEETFRIDARLNSSAAVNWLQAELTRLIDSAGEPVRPPEELQRMLGQTDKA